MREMLRIKRSAQATYNTQVCSRSEITSSYQGLCVMYAIYISIYFILGQYDVSTNGKCIWICWNSC